MVVANGRRMPTASSLGRTRSTWISIVAFALLTYSGTVHAQSTSEPEEEVWYGWQNLAIDGAAFAVAAGGLALEAAAEVQSTDGIWVAFAFVIFTLGSPIADFAHGNVGLGIGSLGLRLSASLLAVVGVFRHALGCEDYEPGESCTVGHGWYALSAVLGVAAVALDGVLDSETVSRGAASLPIGLAVREDGALLTVQGAL
jgi:hypothetical protein